MGTRKGQMSASALTPAQIDRDEPASRGQHGGSADSLQQQIEIQLHELRRELKITVEQEPQFDFFAEVLRSNVEMMSTVVRRQAEEPTTNAMDDLKAIGELAELQQRGLQKLIPAFQTLYASLTDQQKQIADKIFRRRPSPSPQPRALQK
jgi:hypothetical protein